MKGYYICENSNTRFAGVDKKIDNQIKALCKFFEVYKVGIEKTRTNIVKSIVWRMPFGSFGRDYSKAYDEIKNPDFIYIRKPPIDKKFLEFLKELYEKHRKCLILLEVPTYPYGKELLLNLTMAPFYFKDLCYRRKINKYVDRVITFSNDKSIFGIPTIKTRNGIIVDDIPMICSLKEDKQIHLLAVAKIQFYAGYDRVIRGLNQYKKNGGSRIDVSIVGDGSEKEKLVHLSEQFGLSDIIKFYPPIYGEKLDKMYEMADATLEVFGWHRTGVKVSSTLKSRESLAKGLPIVTGSKLDICMDMGITPEFICEFPPDDSDIDFFRVEEFYDKLMKNRDRISLAKEIRKYAKNMIDMSVTMQPVIEYIKSGKKEQLQ